MRTDPCPCLWCDLDRLFTLLASVGIRNEAELRERLEVVRLEVPDAD